MLELALKAGIPIIGVHSDDPVHRCRVLQSIAGVKTYEYDKYVKQLAAGLYWCDDQKLVDEDLYLMLRKNDRTLIVFNPEPSDLIMDVGDLPTPPSMTAVLAKAHCSAKDVPATVAVLKGLSLKRADEVLKMASAKSSKQWVTPAMVRQMRHQLGETVQGLYPVDTTFDFYEFPEKLKAWLALNKPYFLSPTTPPKLVPRGVLLDGTPGVGKSMAAKAIANELGVPLYRLDIASTLNKYIGESEARIVRSLALMEREGPCVMLLDEVEKIFVQGGEDGGVTTRIMSQLLWWLSDHQSKVLTVMTTNNVSAIPPEMYRTGRVDMVMRIPRMGLTDARNFSVQVYAGVVGVKMPTSHLHTISTALKSAATEDFSHAEVSELVYSCIKQHGWMTS